VNLTKIFNFMVKVFFSLTLVLF